MIILIISVADSRAESIFQSSSSVIVTEGDMIVLTDMDR